MKIERENHLLSLQTIYNEAFLWSFRKKSLYEYRLRIIGWILIHRAFFYEGIKVCKFIMLINSYDIQILGCWIYH